MLPMLSLRRVSFLKLFQRFILSLQSPVFIQKFLSKFFAPQPLKTYRFFTNIRSLSLKPMFTPMIPMSAVCCHVSFVPTFLSYFSAKCCLNWFTVCKVITKIKRVNLLRHSVYNAGDKPVYCNELRSVMFCSFNILHSFTTGLLTEYFPSPVSNLTLLFANFDGNITLLILSFK